MSLTRDDTDFVYDFDHYDQDKLLAEIEVLNKEIEQLQNLSSYYITKYKHNICFYGCFSSPTKLPPLL
jgi:hypothetical protein